MNPRSRGGPFHPALHLCEVVIRKQFGMHLQRPWISSCNNCPAGSILGPALRPENDSNRVLGETASSRKPTATHKTTTPI
jgi:hypothetical protein